VAFVVLAIVATIVPIALLRVLPPPTTAFMLQSRRADPATGRPCDRVAYQFVPRRRISPHVPRAILVAEDQRFFEHSGFDTHAIGDALDEFVSEGRMRGASTVSQQVAKNLFLWPGRSVLRKALEAWLTVWIELLLPKRRILEIHVNVAQFGPCVFGAEAASRRYFGSPAARLSAEQAARLAAVLPAPGKMKVGDPGPFTEERTREILAELQKPGGPAYLQDL
jgi:monofunctional biosynthetic peptidoglycan transglycosylase